MRDLLGLELDPLVVAHELDLVAARLGDLHERVGARVAPAAYEGGKVQPGLAEGLGDAHDALCASAGRERGRRPWLSAARRTDPRQRGCEAEREDTDDGHAPGRPRLTCMPPAARVAFPTRAARPAGPMARTTLDDAARLRGLCARPGGR